MSDHIIGGNMDYRNAQAAPSKHLTGIAVVVVMHFFMAWLVVSGVGAKIILTVVPPLVITPVIPDKPVLPDPPKVVEVTIDKVVLTVPQVPPPVIETERVNVLPVITPEGLKKDPFPIVVAGDLLQERTSQ
jgi:periplasmic protein TonB